MIYITKVGSLFCFNLYKSFYLVTYAYPYFKTRQNYRLALWKKHIQHSTFSNPSHCLFSTAILLWLKDYWKLRLGNFQTLAESAWRTVMTMSGTSIMRKTVITTTDITVIRNESLLFTRWQLGLLLKNTWLDFTSSSVTWHPEHFSSFNSITA